MTEEERREALARIAVDLHRLRLEAEKADAEVLAFLIASAIDEARSRAEWLE
jgi:hypothetical protein